MREQADEVRQLALVELNEMAVQAWAVLRREHVLVSHGRVVSRDGQPVPDDAPILQAIDRLLKIAERRAKLLGLDAPARYEMLTLDALDAEIERLEREVAASRDGGDDG